MRRTHPTGINTLIKSLPAIEYLATAETPFLLVYGQDPNLPLHQLLGPMQSFLGYPDSGMLNVKNHRLALAITKKTLDENHFRTAQKTTDRQPPTLQIGDSIYFKNKHPRKLDLKWKPGYRIVQIEQDGHFLHIENQATGKIQSCNVKDVVPEPPIEFWNIDTQFGRAAKYVNHPANIPTISLHD